MVLPRFGFSCQVSLLIWMEDFLSQDCEPILPSGKEKKPQCTRGSKKWTGICILKQLWKTGPHLKEFSFPLHFWKSNQALLYEPREDPAKNLLTSSSDSLHTGCWNYISTHVTATALFLCVAMEFWKQNKENHWSVIVTKLLSHSIENRA